jgi:glycosyltransferase involved in cell wall biosynthesis
VTDRYLVDELIDWHAASQLRPGSTHFIAESQIGLHSLKKAKRLGMRTFIERTNSHILYQNEILAQEYDRLGINMKYNKDIVIEKGMAEYEEADGIFCLSNYVKKTFIDKGVPSEKLIVVNAGIDTSLFARNTSLRPSEFTILFIGQISVKKGAHMLLEAFHQLNLPKAKLVIIADVWDELEELYKRYAGDNIKRYEYVQYRDLSSLYNSASVLVVPSLEDGGPKVMPEAMACGIPVIASNYTQGEDMITNGVNGFVYDYSSLDQLKSAIVYCYENPDALQEMSLAAEKTAHSLYTLEAYHSRWLKAIEAF